MTKLNEIPVHVELSNESMSMLLPILHEILTMLKTLITSGQSNILDLRHEPLELDEIAALKELLGQGEVNANLNALGSTNIRETSISGVWWITHYNQEDNIIGEFIEITTCPEMLKTFPEELESALVRLQDKLSQYAHPSTPDEIAKRLNELGFNSNNVVPGSIN
jgi:hydrogenase-1 operon protein HyaF